MLDALSARFESIVKKLRGTASISEKNIEETLQDVRRALLDADVNYQVVTDFITVVKEKAIGAQVLLAVSPGQQFTKILHDEMVELLGRAAAPINWKPGGQTVIMVVGLQGSGKTTFAAKLAALLKRKGKNPLLVAADIYRPAAAEQLRILAEQASVPVVTPVENDALQTALAGVARGGKDHHDPIILDTAGRLHIDQEMMGELVRIREQLNPSEILFVADGMTGQDAVTAAREFQRQLDFHGVVLTKMDSDSRGGAALSIKAVTGKPIKFIGIGEKLDALEQFHPDRIASRILGRGDIVTLVEKAQEQVEAQDAEAMAKKLQNATFTLQDFLAQMQVIKKMGPLEGLMKMIPGVGSKLGDMDLDPSRLAHTEAIIYSMTPLERVRPELMNGSRKKRVALGSGTTVQEVNQLLAQFFQMREMMKQMSGSKKVGPKRMKPRRKKGKKKKR